MAERILIIDDEDNIRELLKKILEQEGHECDQAADTTEARACLRKQDYSLLLCDIMMPGESGIDFTASISSLLALLTSVGDIFRPISLVEIIDRLLYSLRSKTSCLHLL